MELAPSRLVKTSLKDYIDRLDFAYSWKGFGKICLRAQKNRIKKEETIWKEN
jgi:hypothetical protein